MQRGQKLDTGVNRLQADTGIVFVLFRDHDRASAAISLRATLLATRAPQIFAQELQHSSGRVNRVNLDDFTIEYEFYCASHVS